MRISLHQAESLLREGAVVAIPTDTVYGLAALYNNEAAIHRIFTLKQRPAHNPMALLIPDKESLTHLVKEIPIQAKELMDEFWPGALTLVLQANQEALSPFICANLPTIGVRIPNHPTTLSLLQALGPLVATSVNLSGQPPLNDPQAIEDLLGQEFPVLVDTHPLLGTASTVISFATDTPTILRQGEILFFTKS